MTTSLHLEPVTPANVHAACRLRVRPEQEQMVAPVAWSLAEAYVHGSRAWPRLIYDGEELVGFVMVGFPDQDPTECGIWRLNISAEKQGRGYGRFAVESVCDEARRRGVRRVTVCWVQDQHGPEKFYLRLGFQPTGNVIHGEIEAELLLPDVRTTSGTP